MNRDSIQPALPTVRELTAMHISKGDLAEMVLHQGELDSIDYALPQSWLNELDSKSRHDYSFLLGTLVWIYPKGWNFGMPCPLCEETANELHLLGYTYWYANTVQSPYDI